MPTKIDRAMIERMTMKQRMVLYEHARNTSAPDADEIIRILLSDGFLDSAGGGLPRGHRVIQEIEAICRSPEGTAAAVRAAREGNAPLAGVDPLLQEAVREYGHFDTTTWAGGFVAEEMEAAGWRRQGQKSLPPNCVARTAAFFLPPESE